MSWQFTVLYWKKIWLGEKTVKHCARELFKTIYVLVKNECLSGLEFCIVCLICVYLHRNNKISQVIASLTHFCPLLRIAKSHDSRKSSFGGMGGNDDGGGGNMADVN